MNRRHPDLIANPCPRCKAYPPCGCTSADLRAFFQETRQIRWLAKLAMDAHRPPPRKPVPAEGAEVFPEHEGDTRPLLEARVDGKLLRMRDTAPEHPVRTLTDDDYCGGPPRDAA